MSHDPSLDAIHASAGITSSNPASPPPARTHESVADGGSEAHAVPSNTACNNSNEPVAELKYLRWGVDSLYLSYQGELDPAIDAKLASLKLAAQSTKRRDQSKAQLKLGQHLFEVYDKGASFFSYILEDNAFRIQLARSGKSVPMAYVKISSEFLTHVGPSMAEGLLSSLLGQLGILTGRPTVSRIDLFIDFVSHQDMEGWHRAAWVTRGSQVHQYAVNQHFTGWTVGLGGAIACRLYDKLTEIMVSNKGYLVPLWEQAGWQMGEPIWRLEFQFKRDFLAQKGIPKFEDVMQHLNGLWSYATTEWLRLTLPNPDDQTRARWPIHPMWATLASFDWETDASPLRRRFDYTRSPRPEVMLDRAMSSVFAWMAAHCYRDYELGIHPFYEALTHRINHLAMNQGVTFEAFVEERVDAKGRKFNTLNNCEPHHDDTETQARQYKHASDGE
ncbi:replication initiation factor [Methylobacillus flagellatus]|uniref:replication initiation factor n=1 Tax=Methylobacillus flagellatus TaxID=405 RepID=UPI002570BC0F|nr:replication initiation factor [Methylobacillus flagellatus]